MQRHLKLGLAAIAIAAAAPAAAWADHHGGTTAEAPAGLKQVIAGKHRSAENKARDQYRNPAETLAFFGLEPDMTVVEITPGGEGWYTEILAPYLAESGKYYAAQWPMNSSTYARRGLGNYLIKLAENPDAYGKVEVTSFAPGKNSAIAPEGSADMVLTFRNIHGWLNGGNAEAAFQTFYAALKPGGVLGVVQHRLPEDRPSEAEGKSGYVKESTVIDLAQKAGFKLAARSDVNANPKDKADYPDGVWTLPPGYAKGDTDRAKYQAIGESDRMTLKFVKPS